MKQQWDPWVQAQAQPVQKFLPHYVNRPGQIHGMGEAGGGLLGFFRTPLGMLVGCGAAVLAGHYLLKKYGVVPNPGTSDYDKCDDEELADLVIDCYMEGAAEAANQAESEEEADEIIDQYQAEAADLANQAREDQIKYLLDNRCL